MRDRSVPPADTQAVEQASAALKAGKRRPAVRLAIEAVKSAAGLPIDEALARERETFEQLRVSREAFALRHHFFAERDSARLPELDGVALRAVQQLTGLQLSQMDVIELNEAFAAQGLAVLRELGLRDDDPRVNPWGGAIALGHPLGASGARLVTTVVNQLHRSGGRYALCTMCIGVGQGIAVVLERV